MKPNAEACAHYFLPATTIPLSGVVGSLPDMILIRTCARCDDVRILRLPARSIFGAPNPSLRPPGLHSVPPEIPGVP